jgi:hypothetical protein
VCIVQHESRLTHTPLPSRVVQDLYLVNYIDGCQVQRSCVLAAVKSVLESTGSAMTRASRKQAMELVIAAYYDETKSYKYQKWQNEVTKPSESSIARSALRARPCIGRDLSAASGARRQVGRFDLEVMTQTCRLTDGH